MDSEGYDYVSRAEKRLKQTGCFAACSSKSEKYEDAIDLYERGAQCFVRSKQFAEAGQCFESIADCKFKIGGDTTSAYEKAAYYFSQVPGSKKSEEYQNKVLADYIKNAKFSDAAKIKKKMAEKLEEDFNYPEAIKAFQQAADYFQMDSRNSYPTARNDCLIKVADLTCETEMTNDKFMQVVQIYEDQIKDYLKSGLLKTKAADLEVKVVSLYLAFRDEAEASAILSRYISDDVNLYGSRPCDFLNKSIEALKARSENMFKDACTELNNFSKLTKWQEVIFKRILSKLSSNDVALNNSVNSQKSGKHRYNNNEDPDYL